MAEQLMPAVKAGRVGTQKPFHPGDQIWGWSFDHQMKMIPHQTVGMHLPARLEARLPESVQKTLMILIVFENGFPPITTVHDMIDRSRIFHPQFAGHARLPAQRKDATYFSTIAGTDPFFG